MIKYFPAMACGFFVSLAFPKAQLSYLAFVSLVPFFVCVRELSPNRSFLWGFYAGFFYFLTLIYWIVPTVHVYGGLHPVLAIATLVFLSAYLSLYPAVFGFALKKIKLNTWYAPLFVSALWTGLEYLRTHAFTGFGWGALGYSQYLNLKFIQIADFSGVYGVSFLIVLINFVLASLWISVKEKTKKPFFTICYTFILVAGTLFYGQHKINAIDSEIKSARKTSVSVVQGNIKQNVKWDKDFKLQTVEKYIDLSAGALVNEPDVVIWPETALPFYYGFDRPMSKKIDEFVRSAKTSFLIGSPAFLSGENQIKYYNRAYMLNRFSIVTGTYDKNHLVPFGEYVPLGEYLTFLGKITAQAGNFSPGEAAFKPLPFDESKTGVLVCFEILFPSISSGFVKNGANILTTITNDAWFGYTSAPEQHFAIAVFRAVENRRSIARAANTGISGFIDPKGKILDTTKLFTDAAVTKKLAILDRISVYTAYGDVFAISAIVAIFLVFVLKGATGVFGKKA